MTGLIRWTIAVLTLAAIVTAAGAPLALAKDHQKLDQSARDALSSLTTGNEAARLLAGKAKAVLVFPSIVKAGFMFGGQVGNGVLFRNGKVVGHYNSVAGSYGLQAGMQVFGYALFFMNEEAIQYLDKTDGWEIGVGPTIVVVDAGVGKAFSTTTLKEDVYAFIFDQKGLMAGMGIQGSKITKLAD